MADIQRNLTKVTDECRDNFDTYKPDPNRPGYVIWWRCPNIKAGYSDWELERYKCEICGYSYTLYDDEMK